MSSKEFRRRKIARQVMKSTWSMFRRCLLSFSTCLRICWKIVRFLTPVHHTKARGTSFGNRQKVLSRLSLYNASDIVLSFLREPSNAYDSNAVAILASVQGKGSVIAGYLSRELAAEIAPFLDSGGSAVVLFNTITGFELNGNYLGLNFSFILF